MAKKLNVMVSHGEAGIARTDMTMPERLIEWDRSLLIFYLLLTPWATQNLVRAGVDEEEDLSCGNV